MTTCPRCLKGYDRKRAARSHLPTGICQQCRFRERGSERVLTRAVNRMIVTIPQLFYRGKCVVCGEMHHDLRCSIGRAELDLMEYRERVRHYATESQASSTTAKH